MPLQAMVLQIDGNSVASTAEAQGDLIKSYFKIFLVIDPREGREFNILDLLAHTLSELKIGCFRQDWSHEDMLVLDS